MTSTPPKEAGGTGRLAEPLAPPPQPCTAMMQSTNPGTIDLRICPISASSTLAGMHRRTYTAPPMLANQEFGMSRIQSILYHRVLDMTRRPTVAYWRAQAREANDAIRRYGPDRNACGGLAALYPKLDGVCDLVRIARVGGRRHGRRRFAGSSAVVRSEHAAPLVPHLVGRRGRRRRPRRFARDTALVSARAGAIGHADTQICVLPAAFHVRRSGANRRALVLRQFERDPRHLVIAVRLRLDRRERTDDAHHRHHGWIIRRIRFARVPAAGQAADSVARHRLRRPARVVRLSDRAHGSWQRSLMSGRPKSPRRASVPS